jgi:streptogramin lyase
MDCLRKTLVAGALLAGCGDNVVSHCDDSGQACTWLGVAGEFGFTEDGEDRLDTKVYWTMDLSFAADGTVWFIDWNNHLVRRVMQNGRVKTYVGWTDPVFPGDGVSGMAERVAPGVLGTDVKLNHPTDLVQTDDGKVLVMAWHNHKLREIDPATGLVRIVAGAGAGYAGDGALLETALFRQPKALERDAAGNLYILDQQNFRVRKVDVATRMMSTVAGNGTKGFAGDNGPATMAMLDFEAGSNPEPSGGITENATTLFISDTLSNRVRAVDLASGMITTVVGTGEAGGGGDGGAATAAQLDKPRDLEIGPEGDLYIADTDNNRIRAVNLTTGVIRTVAGTGTLGLDDRDDLPATETMLARPFAIEFDPAGNLYISDTINSRILRVAR